MPVLTTDNYSTEVRWRETVRLLKSLWRIDTVAELEGEKNTNNREVLSYLAFCLDTIENSLKQYKGNPSQVHLGMLRS